VPPLEGHAIRAKDPVPSLIHDVYPSFENEPLIFVVSAPCNSYDEMPYESEAMTGVAAKSIALDSARSILFICSTPFTLIFNRIPFGTQNAHAF
jgi:hypothetical protein